MENADEHTGTYMVSVDAVPIGATFHQGQFAEAVELRNMGVPVPDDVLVQLSSMPNKREVVRRLAEARDLQIATQQAQALLLQAQLGVPPGQPLPAVQIADPYTNHVPGPVMPPPPPPSPMAPTGATAMGGSVPPRIPGAAPGMVSNQAPMGPAIPPGMGPNPMMPPLPLQPPQGPPPSGPFAFRGI